MQPFCGILTQLGVEYQFIKVPYGVGFAPRYQQRCSLELCTRVLQRFSGRPFWVMCILDDFMVASPDPWLPRTIALCLRDELTSIGFVVHGQSKSQGISELVCEVRMGLWRPIQCTSPDRKLSMSPFELRSKTGGNGRSIHGPCLLLLRVRALHTFFRRNNRLP